jgi:hypothetical protein
MPVKSGSLHSDNCQMIMRVLCFKNIWFLGSQPECLKELKGILSFFNQRNGAKRYFPPEKIQLYIAMKPDKQLTLTSFN